MAAIESEQADVSSLIEVNNMDYRLPPSLSIATSRAMRTYPAQQQSYTLGQTPTIIVSTGATYLDLQNSYISFDIVFKTAQTSVRMPPHCGYNMLFNNYTLVHASGVELDRQNDAVGEWNQTQMYYNLSEQERKIQGSLYNFNDSAVPGSPLQNSTDAYEAAKYGDWDQYTGWINQTKVVATLQIGQQATAADITVGPFEAPTNSDQYNAVTSVPSSGLRFGTKYDSKQDAWKQKYAMGGTPTRDVRTHDQTVDVVDRHWTGEYDEDIDINLKKVHVVLPLQQIAPFFQNTLLAPSYVMAGLRIELTSLLKEQFFQLVPTVTDPDPFWAATDTVTIEGMLFCAETFTLTDAISRKMAQISGATGLEWSWDAVAQSSLQTPNTTTSIQVNRALSRANAVILLARNQSQIATSVQGQQSDYFGANPWNLKIANTTNYTQNQAWDGTMTSFQVQLGAQYIPAQPITLPADYLHSALKTFSAFRRNDRTVGVPLWDFIGPKMASYDGTNVQTPTEVAESTGPIDLRRAALARACVPLESSSTLQQSGAAISAQRTCVINMTWQYGRADNTQRRVDCFIPYTKLSSHFLDSVTVRS